MNNIIDRLILPYEKSSYEILGRVRAFLQFTTALVPILVVFFIVMNVLGRRSLFHSLNIAIYIISICIAISLVLTARGYFNAAVTVFALAAMLGLANNMHGTESTGSPVRFLPAVASLLLPVSFCTLFSHRYVLVGMTALAETLAVVGIAFTGTVPGELKGIVIGSMSLIIVIIGLIGYLINRINDSARKMRIDENAREREKSLADNTSMLESLKDVSKKLDESSRLLSEYSAMFAGNIQSQAASIEEVTATIEQISAGADSANGGAEAQASAIESLSGLIGELASVTADMEARMTETRSLTQEISRTAESGATHIGGMNRSMQEIGDTSRQMTGILAIINDISDRINLLSLNASIEAARAGEHGRGFAVVADEIGKLADQTSTSVKEIDALIKKSENEIAAGLVTVKETVEVLRKTIDGVGISNSMMENMNTGMRKYVQSNDSVRRETERISVRSDEIRNTMHEQKLAAEEVVGTITAVNGISQENAMSAGEITRQAERIAAMAFDLKDKIAGFDPQWSV